MTYKRHRTQRLLLPLWKYFCSIRARSRNSFTFKKKVNKDRDHKQRVQGRIYKHMTHKWHRRKRQLLPMGKYYRSIKARSRNSFTVSKELKTIGTKSTHLTARLQRCDPKKKQRRQRLMLPLGEYYCHIKARSRNFFTFKIKLVKTETTSYEFNAEITNM